ncbi:hypothetical protein QUF49_11755 [Fictibacillus sp. b24]|uniref:hypothetical protein n=1 Tax=Fictibacillus sp. b24 TaxID=3055863 RepID=UPI0025A24310|nr:hypothetical protein [Fictibacillus sp. b24]MDM5316672.1 hypothetical protein [Fictibacillus sp. b24]
MRDSCGTSGQVRPLMAQSGKGLTDCPAESERLKRKSTLSDQQNLQISLLKKKKKHCSCRIINRKPSKEGEEKI